MGKPRPLTNILKVRKQIIGENLVYSVVWAAVYLIPIMNSTLMSEEHISLTKVLIAWIKISPYFALFLINNQILIRFLLMKHRYIWYLLTSFVLLGTTFGCIEWYEQWSIAQAGGYAGEEILPRRASLTDLEWYWNIMLGMFMFGMNVGIKMLYKSMQNDEDNERRERQNIQAEIYYLKYQINPHFLMNTLNNIHALIDIDADSAKQFLIELSSMMRYVVYESSADAIPLRRDIQFLANYIELMRIRYSQDIDIQLNYPKDIRSSVTIPPLVLIVFVENAFKHGVSQRVHSFIHIDISTDEQWIVARFANSVYDTANGKHSAGIGLENVRKRLELIYGNNFSIDIDESDPKQYVITLKIPNDNVKVYSH